MENQFTSYTYTHSPTVKTCSSHRFTHLLSLYTHTYTPKHTHKHKPPPYTPQRTISLVCPRSRWLGCPVLVLPEALNKRKRKEIAAATVFKQNYNFVSLLLCTISCCKFGGKKSKRPNPSKREKYPRFVYSLWSVPVGCACAKLECRVFFCFNLFRYVFYVSLGVTEKTLPFDADPRPVLYVFFVRVKEARRD